MNPPPIAASAYRRRIADGLGRGARAAGAAAAVLGAAAIVGWATGADPIGRLAPGIRAPRPVTALGLVLAGGALWLDRKRPWKRAAAAVAAAAIVALGLVRLAAYELDWNLGADRPIAAVGILPGLGTRPVRISPNSTLCLVMVGVALGLMDRRSRRRDAAVQLLGLATGLVALSSMIGFTYVSALHGAGQTQSISIVSSVAFLVLAAGLLCARPDRGLMRVVTSRGGGGVMTRRLLPTIVIIPTVLGWLALEGQRWGALGTATSVALLVGLNILVFVLLVWWSARLIDRTEADRQRSDEALRASEVVYHSLVETLPQNILRKDPDGHFTFVNQRFCETVGHKREEIIGRRDVDLFPTPLARKYRQDDQQVMETGIPIDVVEEHVTPDGQVHYVQVIKSPLYGPDGAVVGVQGIFWDVTARRRAEEQLRAQNEKLQEMALSERLAHEELKQAQSRMVQTAKLAGLGEMVAGVAHEINNPLSFVGNNVVVLQRDLAEILALLAIYREADDLLARERPELGARIATHCDDLDMDYTLGNLNGLLDRTREGLRRIQQIVKDLRVFARLDEGDLNEVDLNAGIESTVNIILGNAKRKQIRVDLDLGPLPPVICFPAKINQVVMNLTSNAIDACGERGHVAIRTRAEGPWVLIEIEDDGCGIESAVREKIFDPFFTTKPVGVGTGLGLSISYGIVEDHKGTIEVDSTPGAGTKFTVRLPCRLEPSTPRRRRTTPEALER